MKKLLLLCASLVIGGVAMSQGVEIIDFPIEEPLVAPVAVGSDTKVAIFSILPYLYAAAAFVLVVAGIIISLAAEKIAKAKIEANKKLDAIIRLLEDRR